MNKRKACFVGLAAAATLLAGCVAQYRNPSACEQEMRRRLADVSPAELSVTHSAVAYQGKRVVVEGTLDRAFAPASGAVAASSARAASDGTEAVGEAEAAASGAVAASGAFAASGVPPVAARGASSAAAVAASSAAVAAAASGASAAKASSEPKPTTPMAVIAQKLGIKKAVHPAAAAECTFNESGLTAFRWLAPPALAKTTPDPDASDD